MKTGSTILKLLLLSGLWSGLGFSPALSLPIQSLDIGTQKGFSTERSKTHVLLFLSHDCPCVNSHLAHLSELQETFTDFQFVGVQFPVADKEQELMDFYRQAELSFPVLMDEKFELINKYKALRTPHVFILRNEAQILYQGSVSDSTDIERSQHRYLEQALVQLRKDEPVKPNKTRPLGCVIPRR